MLCLHGFAGNESDVQLVAEVAQELGLEWRIPLLPGHGTSVSALAKERWGSWADAARAHVDELSCRGPVIVAGFSLGALLALHLARSRPDTVRGIALMGTPLRLGFPIPALPLCVAHHLPFVDAMVPKRGSNVLAPEATAAYSGYTLQPLRAASEVWWAGREEQRHLADIVCPVLALHGVHDVVSPLSNLRRLVQGLRGTTCHAVSLPRSAHVVTRDLDREVVRAEILAFFAALSAQATPVEP